jgi:hypothetical protein
MLVTLLFNSIAAAMKNAYQPKQHVFPTIFTLEDNATLTTTWQEFLYCIHIIAI